MQQSPASAVFLITPPGKPTGGKERVMSTGATILLIIVVLAVLLAVGWFVANWMRSRRLRDRFGPEYERRLEATGNRRAAERELTELRKRHDSLDLKPMPEQSRERYTEQWVLVQERFVDQPAEAVAGAEQLVRSAMRERGYPTDGFDQEAADLSVEHGSAVNDYRMGHDISHRNEHGEVSTEELRQALVHYRRILVSVVGNESDVDTRRGFDDATR
jgi:hypothetical protein